MMDPVRVKYKDLVPTGMLQLTRMDGVVTRKRR